MRRALALAALVLAAAAQAPVARAQEGAGAADGRTFKAMLFFVPGSTDARGLKIERFKEVLSEDESAGKLGVWIEGGTPERLEVVTITPGQEKSVVKYKDLTFRISGLYRGPQKDRMFLEVSFDQRGQAAVKEFLAGLDETVIVTYPLIGKEGSIVALLVPSG
jgi:hypothetical protein